MAQGKFKVMSEKEIVNLAKQGNLEAIEYLMRRYKGVVLFKSRSYFLRGGDRDDMVQEGMIGVFEAIRDFRPDRGCSFRTFVDVCITCQMITAVKADAEQHQIPLILATDLHDPVAPQEGDEDTFESVAVDNSNPLSLFISREIAQELHILLQDILSLFEWSILTTFLEGKSYQEIVEEHGCDTKSIDNALTRVRRKVNRFSHLLTGNEPPPKDTSIRQLITEENYRKIKSLPRVLLTPRQWMVLDYLYQGLSEAEIIQKTGFSRHGFARTLNSLCRRTPELLSLIQIRPPKAQRKSLKGGERIGNAGKDARW